MSPLSWFMTLSESNCLVLKLDDKIKLRSEQDEVSAEFASICNFFAPVFEIMMTRRLRFVPFVKNTSDTSHLSLSRTECLRFQKLPHIPKQSFAYGYRRELQLWFLSGAWTDLTRPQGPYANHPLSLFRHCQASLPQVLFLAGPVITKQIIHCKRAAFPATSLFLTRHSHTVVG